MIYFDHAATSPMRPEAIEALKEYLELVGNPAALHRQGQRARKLLEEAREELAEAAGCDPAELVFTSGGSEANTIAVLGVGRAAERKRVCVSAIEHPAVLDSTRYGAEIIPVNTSGQVEVDQIPFSRDVALVSTMMVNNETGILQPISEIVERSLRSKILVHTDAVQAFGHVPCKFKELGVDLMSLSAHKIGGPVGIGALILRRSISVVPPGLGGGQERKIRSGTQAVALAKSFAVAARLAQEELRDRTAQLSRYFDRISSAMAEIGARVNTARAPHSPHIVNVTFEQIRANDMLFLLDQRGICASVGSACRAGVHQPSAVLLAMGRSLDEAASTLRFSMGWNTTSEDVDELICQVRRCLELAQLAF